MAKKHKPLTVKKVAKKVRKLYIEYIKSIPDEALLELDDEISVDDEHRYEEIQRLIELADFKFGKIHSKGEF